MEVINHKLITFQIYQQIIQDCLNEAQKLYHFDYKIEKSLTSEEGSIIYVSNIHYKN